MKKNVENVKKSYGRCLNAGDFVGRFYEIFLQSHPDVAPKFKNTDMPNQKKLLRFGINYLIMFANKDMAGESAINRIASTHAKDQINIPPYLYSYWRASLLKTIREFDYAYSETIGKDWKTVLDLGIAQISGKYIT